MGIEKIAEYKKKLGMSTEELSEKSGMPPGTVNKILCGATTNPKLKTLKSLAKPLGLTLGDFDDVEEGSDSAYEQIENLIARNGKNLSREKRLRLIKSLSKIQNEEDDPVGIFINKQ